MTSNNVDCTILPISCNEDDRHQYKVVQIVCDFPSNSVNVNERCLEDITVDGQSFGLREPDYASSIAVCGSNKMQARSQSAPAVAYHQSRLSNSQPQGQDSDRGPECFLYDHKTQTAKADIHREPSPPRKQGFKKYDCHCYK